MTRPRADQRTLVPACFFAILVAAATGSFLTLLLLTGPGPLDKMTLLFFPILAIGVFYAAGHFLLLALPLYLLLSRRGPVGLPATAAAGLLIGALPLHFIDGGLIQPGMLETAISGLSGLAGALAFRWASNRIP